jgi:predicted transcriptional regulator
MRRRTAVANLLRNNQAKDQIIGEVLGVVKATVSQYVSIPSL